MKIDKRLSLVIPHEQADGSIAFIHSTPITTETFNQHFEVLAILWSQLISDYGASSGPRIAAMLLRKIATDRGVLDGPLGVERGLLAEMRRLTMVIMPRGSNPGSLMLDEAISGGVLTKEDTEIVENALVFFTAVSSMVSGKRRTVWLETMCSLWDAQTSALNSTDFATSLPTLTGTGNSGETAKA